MAFFGSIAIELINRPGSFITGSTRFHTTEPAAAFALSETNTRPAPVATQTVPVLLGVRWIQATAVPGRVFP